MSDAPTTLETGGLERIYDAIEAILPGVMHPVVQMVVYDALDEFCTKSTYWRQLFAWSMAPGQTRLDLNPPGASPLVRWVLGVSGMRCHRIAPTAILVDTGDTSVIRSGTVWAACTPVQLENLPPWVNDWSEAIRAGALFRLYSHPKKPYSDPRLAPYYGKLFRQQITLAKIEAQKLCERDAWHYPYFARGRGSFGWGDGCCLGDPVLDARSGITVTLPVVSISPGVITEDAPTVTVGPGVITDVPVGGAAYTLSALMLSFPDEPTATASPDETITITNTGTVPLVITSATVTGDFTIIGLSLP